MHHTARAGYYGKLSMGSAFDRPTQVTINCNNEHIYDNAHFLAIIHWVVPKWANNVYSGLTHLQTLQLTTNYIPTFALSCSSLFVIHYCSVCLNFSWILFQNLSGICKLTMGFMAGSAATITNTPFDVAKSRIQGPQPPDDLLKYKDLLRTLSTMFREEG